MLSAQYVRTRCLGKLIRGYFYHRIVVYYYKMLKDSNEKKIKLLKLQIAIVSRVSLGASTPDTFFIEKIKCEILRTYQMLLPKIGPAACCPAFTTNSTLSPSQSLSACVITASFETPAFHVTRRADTKRRQIHNYRESNLQERVQRPTVLSFT